MITRALVTIAILTALSLAFASSSFAGEIELKPATGLDFSKKMAKEKEKITATNVTGAEVSLLYEYITEGGVQSETNFKIVGAGGANACGLPGLFPPFQKLAEGASCEVGVEFVTGAKGLSAVYVLEYGNVLCPNMETLPIKS